MGTAIFSRNIKTIKTRQFSTLVVDSINTQINGFATIWDEGYEYINMDTFTHTNIYVYIYITRRFGSVHGEEMAHLQK